MRPEEFWDSTFGELEVFFEGASAARRDAINMAITVGWNVERFARTKGALSSLDKYLLGLPTSPAPARPLKRELAVWDRFYDRLGVKGA